MRKDILPHFPKRKRSYDFPREEYSSPQGKIGLPYSPLGKMRKDMFPHFDKREGIYFPWRNILPPKGRFVFPTSPYKLGRTFFFIFPKGKILLPQGRILFPFKEDQSSLLHLMEEIFFPGKNIISLLCLIYKYASYLCLAIKKSLLPKERI